MGSGDTDWQRIDWIGADTLPRGFTHLACPLLVPREHGFLCFASARDAKRRSHLVVGKLVVDGVGAQVDAWRVIAEPGDTGRFDDSGLTLSDIWPTSDAGAAFSGLTFGWQLPMAGGWVNAIGRIDLDADLRVIARSSGPIITGAGTGTESVGYAVRSSDHEALIHCATTEIDPVTRQPLNFRVQEQRAGDMTVLVDPADGLIPGMFAVTRPWLVDIAGVVHVWASVRGATYRLRHGLLRDDRIIGLNREDSWALPPSQWRGEGGATCYASIVHAGDSLLMVYNGAGYGETGFGLARLDLRAHPEPTE